MKLRAAALLASVIVILGLAACGKSDNPSIDVPSTTTVVSTSTSAAP